MTSGSGPSALMTTPVGRCCGQSSHWRRASDWGAAGRGCGARRRAAWPWWDGAAPPSGLGIDDDALAPGVVLGVSLGKGEGDRPNQDAGRAVLLAPDGVLLRGPK